MSTKQKLLDSWAQATPTKRNVVLLSGVGLLAVAGAMVMDAGGSEGGPKRKAPAPASRTQLNLPKAPDRSLETLAASGQSNSNEISRLSKELQQEREDKKLLLQRLESDKANQKPDGVTADLLNEFMALKKRVDEVESAKATQTSSASAPDLKDPLPDSVGDPAESAQHAEPATQERRLRVSGTAKPSAKKAVVDAAKPAAYLPPGAFLEASLLNGMDAATNSIAQKNPVPAVLRVKSEALLPNHFTYDIRECFILVSGYGVMSSERAHLRTETISCVKEDGRVVEGKISGYVIGEDGRVGVRGPLVSKQGQMIARSLAAGALAGFGQALTPTTIPQINLSPNSSALTQTTDLGTVAQSGVARGLSDASKQASAFFLEMAREMTPVVEINAGRKVTVAITQGLELK